MFIDDDGRTLAEIFNFAEFPLLKLLLALMLVIASWFAMREIFDRRMAEMRWIGNGVFILCALAFWYLILTVLSGYSETVHGLLARVNAVMALVIDGIAQLFHGKPHG